MFFDIDIGMHIANYYDNLFVFDNSLSRDFSVLDNFSWGHVSESQNIQLVALPSDEEIKDAVFDLSADSSPGPDVSL